MNLALYFASFFDASFSGDGGIFFSFAVVEVIIRDAAAAAAADVAVCGGEVLIVECLDDDGVDVEGEDSEDIIAFRADVPANVNDLVRFFNDLVIFFR